MGSRFHLASFKDRQDVENLKNNVNRLNLELNS